MNGYLGMKDHHTLYIKKAMKIIEEGSKNQPPCFFLSFVKYGGFGVLGIEKNFGNLIS